MKVKRKPINKISNELELRKWCIDQAVRWGWHYGTSASLGGYTNSGPQEPDVIGRANRIYDWVIK